MEDAVEIELDDQWSIGGRPHGGYLLRETVTPVVSETHPHPLAVSAHYLRSPDPGPATVEIETLRVGRSVSQHRARLVQNGEAKLEALVTSGTLHADTDPYWSSSAPPDMPALEDCPRSPTSPAPGFRIGHLDFVETHPDPRTNPFAGTNPPPGRVAAWLQMASGPTTALDLLVMADAMQPVPMAMGINGWFPTVELTVLLRSLPALGFLIGEQRMSHMQDGWFEEDCSIWDSRGRLVCQGRQLAGYRAS